MKSTMVGISAPDSRGSYASFAERSTVSRKFLAEDGQIVPSYFRESRRVLSRADGNVNLVGVSRATACGRLSNSERSLLGRG